MRPLRHLRQCRRTFGEPHRPFSPCRALRCASNCQDNAFAGGASTSIYSSSAKDSDAAPPDPSLLDATLPIRSSDLYGNEHAKTIRRVYFISDRTGLTSEGMGESLLSQFNESDVKFKMKTFPYVDDVAEMDTALSAIRKETQGGPRPIIFSSIVNCDVRRRIDAIDSFHIDFYQSFIEALEVELSTKAKHVPGMTHGNTGEKYFKRIEALNFTLNHDDGITDKGLQKADVILVGVSRSGKTPTCLYMALQYGIRSANYPLTPDDLEQCPELPNMLKPYKGKLFGLTINPERLSNIREERRPGSHYASLSNCDDEVRRAEILFKAHGIPYLSSTHKSVEELAVKVLQLFKLKRRF